MLNEAVPLLSGICASDVEPSSNVTIPVGVGGPPETVAVKETDWPEEDGFGAELSAVLEAKAWTFCIRLALPAGKFASQL